MGVVTATATTVAVSARMERRVMDFIVGSRVGMCMCAYIAGGVGFVFTEV